MNKYEPNIFTVIGLILIVVCGIMMHCKEKRDVACGRKPGVRSSNGLFDWLFWNYRDRN